jgi:hypothetical protein
LLQDSGFGADAVHVTDATRDDAAPEHGGRGMMESIRRFFETAAGRSVLLSARWRVPF